MARKTKKIKYHISGSLGIQYLKEGNMFIAYTPTLDLSTCGDTFKKATSNFTEALGIFFEECIKHGTLDTVLKNYGWTKDTKKRPASWSPPELIGQENIPLETLPVFA